MTNIKSLAMILAVSFISVAASAQEWTVNKIMDLVTIRMPGTAVETSKAGQTGHQLALPDSTKFSFLTINFEDFGLNEDALAQMLDTDEFAEQYRSGISSQGEIISEKKGMLDNKYTYFEYLIKVDDGGKPATSYLRTTFYKSMGIATVYTPGQKVADLALKDKYFDSMEIGK